MASALGVVAFGVLSVVSLVCLSGCVVRINVSLMSQVGQLNGRGVVQSKSTRIGVLAGVCMIGASSRGGFGIGR